MANEPVKKITVPEGSSLAKLLTDAAARPIVLKKTVNCTAWNGWRRKTKRLALKKFPAPVMGFSKQQAVGRALIPRRLKRTSLTVGRLPIVPQARYEQVFVGY
jgi:hypothetical protein